MINCCYFLFLFLLTVFLSSKYSTISNSTDGWNENLPKWNRFNGHNFFISLNTYHFSTLFDGAIINSHLNEFSSNFIFCHSIVCCVHDFHFFSSSSSEFSALKSRNLCYENDEAVTVNEFTFFIAFKLNHFNNM